MADRLRSTVRDAALDETDSFRDDTREMMLRALDGLPPLPRPVPIVIAPPRERRPVSVRTVMIGFGAAFVLLGILTWSATRPEPSPSAATDVSTTSAAPTTTIDPGAALLAELQGHTWVLTGAAGDVTIGVSRPYLEFLDTGAKLTNGFDGCNVFGQQGTITDGRLAITASTSTKIGCDELTSLLPADRDRIATSVDGAELLLLTQASSAPRLTYRRIDRLGTLPTDVTGTWSVGGERLQIRDDGTITFGACVGSWTFDTGVVTFDGVTAPAGSACLDSAVMSTLVGPALTPAAATASSLWLLDDPHAVLLERDESSIDPDGITLGIGAAFGLRPGDMLDVDEEIARISAAFATPRQPDLDTGWYDVAADSSGGGPTGGAACTAGRSFRVVWWGDVRLAFWQEGSQGRLWNWSVGDRDVMWYGRSEPRDQPEAPPVVLVTETGVAVGVDDTKVDRGVFGPAEPGGQGIDISRMIEPPAFGGDVTIGQRDGIVVGFGAQLTSC
jgi:heat shock protein HslJ